MRGLDESVWDKYTSGLVYHLNVLQGQNVQTETGFGKTQNVSKLDK